MTKLPKIYEFAASPQRCIYVPADHEGSPPPMPPTAAGYFITEQQLKDFWIAAQLASLRSEPPMNILTKHLEQLGVG